MGNNTYYKNNKKYGKFMQFVIANGFEDDNIDDELGENTDIENCSLIEFDNKNFHFIKQ